MAIGALNPNHFKANKETNSQESQEKKKGNKRLIAALMLGASAMAAMGTAFAWAFGGEKAKAEAEALSASQTQIESTQASHETTSENSGSNVDSSNTKTVETAISSEYSKWSSGDYQKTIDNLEASTIDNLTPVQIMSPEDISQDKIIELASFYMDEDVNNKGLYFVFTDKEGKPNDEHLSSLPAYKEYMNVLNDTVDSPEKGRAIVESIFYAKIDAFNAHDIKRSMTILRSVYLTKSVGGGRITTSGVCSNAMDQIIAADKDYRETGSVTVFKNDEDYKPEFLRFVETTPKMTDYAGNTYENGKIIEYKSNDKILYMLTTKLSEKRFDYKGDEINIPMAVTYGDSPDSVKESAKDLVIFSDN